MNGVGDTVACSSAGSDIGGADRGRVRVFMWSGTTWLQMGATIVGGVNGAYLGWSVGLDASGSVLAVGANGYSFEGLVDRGRATVYMWEDGGRASGCSGAKGWMVQQAAIASELV